MPDEFRRNAFLLYLLGGCYPNPFVPRPLSFVAEAINRYIFLPSWHFSKMK